MHIPDPLLLGAIVVLVGALTASLTERAGAPVLLALLGIGMLLGEDGPGGVAFDDYELVRDAATVALAVILLEGGFLADRRALRPVAVPAILLATVGVAVTAGTVAVATRVALDLPWGAALLAGAVVSSTDAAAVFSAMRGVHVRERLAAVLEGESGINDPVAAVFVIVIVEWLTEGAMSTPSIVLLVAQQAALGIAGGVAAGLGVAWLVRRLPMGSAGIVPVVVLASAIATYAVVGVAGGSGLLAAYVMGLALDSHSLPQSAAVRGFLQGAAWLAQVGMFVVLGLLVTPSDLPNDALAACAIALALVFVARPLAVIASCLPARAFSWRERTFVAWAGLRGAVPIVFATIAVAGGVSGGERLFDLVFFVVVASVALQGLTLRHAAGALGVEAERPPVQLADLDAESLHQLGATAVEVVARDLDLGKGESIGEVRLPAGAVVMAIRRGAEVVLPRGDTRLEPEDVLYLLVERAREGEVRRTAQ